MDADVDSFYSKSETDSMTQRRKGAGIYGGVKVSTGILNHDQRVERATL